MRAQGLDIGDKVGGGIGVKLEQWSGTPAAALVKLDGFPDDRIGIAAVARIRARTRPAMQEEQAASAFLPGAFPVEAVAV